MKYDKEHKDSLSKYPELRERMQSLLQQGEKITPKQWKAEIQSLQAEYDNIGKEESAQGTPKRKIKDRVFTNLFQDKKYLLRLYKALHPEVEQLM